MKNGSVASRRERRLAGDSESLRVPDNETPFGAGCHDWPLRPSLVVSMPTAQTFGLESWKEAAKGQICAGESVSVQSMQECENILKPGRCFSNMQEDAR